MNLHIKEWFGLAAVTAMGNYLTPFLGRPGRSGRLPEASSRLPLCSLSGDAGCKLHDRLCRYQCHRGRHHAHVVGTENYSWLVLFFFLATLSTILLVSLFLLRRRSGGRIGCCVSCNRPWRAWQFIRRDRVLLWKLVALTFFNIVIGALLFFVVFHSMGIDHSIQDGTPDLPADRLYGPDQCHAWESRGAGSRDKPCRRDSRSQGRTWGCSQR